MERASRNRTLRLRIEAGSAPVLRWLTARPKLLLPLLAAALLIGGLAAPRLLGGVLLLVLVLVVGWLSYLSWPMLQPVQQVLRVATLGLLVAATVSRLAR